MRKNEDHFYEKSSNQFLALRGKIGPDFTWDQWAAFWKKQPLLSVILTKPHEVQIVRTDESEPWALTNVTVLLMSDATKLAREQERAVSETENRQTLTRQQWISELSS